ncbi:MAG: hypothetical protein DI539_28385 [Flavobacterium psychrophilum]|nr:MAG: hypothetical protein DI539_28385 [Flavobacterium psychrophilum]
MQNWNIPVNTDFQLITNNDSIQYIKNDESIVLYFSLLHITNNSLLPENVMAKIRPSVSSTENGWDFKGAKVSPNGKEILTCVFSFTNESDQAFLNDLFKNITYVNEG